MSSLALPLPLSPRTAPRAAAFGQIVRNEARLIRRQPVNMIGSIGVPVVHELRGVGRNMQDHYTARVSYPVVGMATANEKSRGIPLALEVVRWAFTGKGMLSYSPSLVAASVKILILEPRKRSSTARAARRC